MSGAESSLSDIISGLLNVYELISVEMNLSETELYF